MSEERKDNDTTKFFPRGMSLRDWFAGMAMTGYIVEYKTADTRMEHVATNCYEFADAMLKERAK